MIIYDVVVDDKTYIIAAPDAIGMITILKDMVGDEVDNINATTIDDEIFSSGDITIHTLAFRKLSKPSFIACIDNEFLLR